MRTNLGKSTANMFAGLGRHQKREVDLHKSKKMGAENVEGCCWKKEIITNYYFESQSLKNYHG